MWVWSKWYPELDIVAVLRIFHDYLWLPSPTNLYFLFIYLFLVIYLVFFFFFLLLLQTVLLWTFLQLAPGAHLHEFIYCTRSALLGHKICVTSMSLNNASLFFKMVMHKCSSYSASFTTLNIVKFKGWASSICFVAFCIYINIKWLAKVFAHLSTRVL